ncbi:succinate dehydrogenase cytochrome b subunit [Granulicoccus sp. GXG6511]|uniref:succinate dehydrogenase cytochrome b subunit n=1 Tax=Granulicoccus sp. GXG6511 TaxID=3381351 RepID=UPI003D7D082A
MAVTGVVFVAFVFIHMIGNLKVYGGPESLDSYARWLREVGYPLIPHGGVLWSLRIVLVVSLIAHVGAALALWWRGRRARGRHRRRRLRGFTAYAARTMLLGGVIILAFVIVHILDLTIGAGVAPAAHQHPQPDGTIHAYANLVASFSRVPMALFYAVSMVVIAIHIIHGWRTILQDVGATGRRLRRVWITIGVLVALAIVVGNAAIPLLVLAGVIA